MISPGHPQHGFSLLGDVQKNLSLRFKDLQNSMNPLHKSINSTITAASVTVSDTLTSLSTDSKPDKCFLYIYFSSR